MNATLILWPRALWVKVDVRSGWNADIGQAKLQRLSNLMESEHSSSTRTDRPHTRAISFGSLTLGFSRGRVRSSQTQEPELWSRIHT